jgi:sugar phosphate permease
MAFVMMLVMFQWLIPSNASRGMLMLCLPIFGFFTVGMHAGYAVYFPELYPTRLRGTGTGFCFNMGRLGTAAAFFGFAAMASPPTPETKAMWLAPLFLLGVVVVLFAKETRDEELPE